MRQHDTFILGPKRSETKSYVIDSPVAPNIFRESLASNRAFDAGSNAFYWPSIPSRTLSRIVIRHRVGYLFLRPAGSIISTHGRAIKVSLQRHLSLLQTVPLIHSGNSRPGPKGPCRFFSSGNGCRFGKGCKFSHNVGEATVAASQDGTPRSVAPDASQASARPTVSPAHVRPPPSASQLKLEEELRGWINLLPRQKSLSTYEARAKDTQKFFSVGWNLVTSGSPDASQRIVTNLATESGLRMVKAVTDCLEDEQSDPVAATTFKTMTLPLFRILSHPNTRSSLILETPLDTIYNWLFGPSGHRLIYVFRSTSQVLRYLLFKEAIDSGDGFREALTATLLVLHAICQLHQKAQVRIFRV